MIGIQKVYSQDLQSNAIMIPIEEVEKELEFIKINYVNLTRSYEKNIRFIYYGQLCTIGNLLGIDYFGLYQSLEKQRLENEEIERAAGYVEETEQEELERIFGPIKK